MQQMKAIVVERLGGPEVLEMRELPTPEPGPGQLLVDVAAAGVNFMDTGARRYGPTGVELPYVPGVEAAGTVRATGPGVDEFMPGDRVAWAYSNGTYAERIVIPAATAVPVPDEISDEVAAAAMLQGLTAHGFATEAYDVRPGDTAVVHAAAGGLGQLLTQMVKLRGGSVIAVVSRPEKAEIARRAGADHVLVASGAEFLDRARELTAGRGADVVFDGNGESTFHASMRVLRRYGTMLYYGPFIGSVPTIEMLDLPNSIKICYPVFFDHIPTREALLRNAGAVFALIKAGKLRIDIGRRYELAEAARAHADIESRRTTGKLLLIP
jgi:NADPH:quinone reductase-like Zn-dependent oxidoreductase